MGHDDMAGANDSHPHNDAAGLLFHHQKEYYENIIVRNDCLFQSFKSI